MRALTFTGGYQGNLNNAGEVVAGGTKKWAGLYKSELNDPPGPGSYAGANWAGTDCMGFIWHGINKAFDEIGGAAAGLELGTIGALKLENPNSLTQTFSTEAFRDRAAMHGNVYYHYVNNRLHRDNVHRGDFGVKKGHAYTVYSEKWDDVGAKQFAGFDSHYDIIHAFGFDCNDVANDITRQDCIDGEWWYRKAGVTVNRRPWLTNINDFGRLLLWD